MYQYLFSINLLALPHKCYAFKLFLFQLLFHIQQCHFYSLKWLQLVPSISFLSSDVSAPWSSFLQPMLSFAPPYSNLKHTLPSLRLLTADWNGPHHQKSPLHLPPPSALPRALFTPKLISWLDLALWCPCSPSDFWPPDYLCSLVLHHPFTSQSMQLNVHQVQKWTGLRKLPWILFFNNMCLMAPSIETADLHSPLNFQP